MGEFNSDDHYIYYYGQESLRRNGVAIIVNKSPKYSIWVQSQKWQNYLCSFPRKPFIITIIQVYAPNSNAEKAETEQFYEDLQDLLELFSFSFFSITAWDIDLDYCDIEWFALETNRDHSVIFEIAPKYCILDSLLTWGLLHFF